MNIDAKILKKKNLVNRIEQYIKEKNLYIMTKWEWFNV